MLMYFVMEGIGGAYTREGACFKNTEMMGGGSGVDVHIP